MDVRQQWTSTAQRLLTRPCSAVPHWSLTRWLAGITLGQLTELERQDNARLLSPPPAGHNLKAHYRALLVEALQARILTPALAPALAVDLSRLDETLRVTGIPEAPDLEPHADEVADWLALELLHGDPDRIERAYATSHRVSPFGLAGEMIAPLQMLARGAVPVATSSAVETVFWGAYFLTRFDPAQVIVRELAGGGEPERWRCWRAAAVMDERLVNEDGRSLAYLEESKAWRVEVLSSTGSEFRYGASLDGQGQLSVLSAATGMLFSNPWGAIDSLLDPRYHKRVCKGRNTHARLRRDDVSVVLAIEVPSGLVIDPAAIDAFRAWFEAGLPWLRQRHGWFTGQLEVRFERAA